MKTWMTWAIAAILAASAAGGVVVSVLRALRPIAEETKMAVPLRPVFVPGRPIPLVDAVQTWRLGTSYFDTPTEVPVSDGVVALLPPKLPPLESIPLECVFTGIDLARSYNFLKYLSIHVQPAVQFGCAIMPTPYEEALVRALASDDPDLALQALVLLMKARAPQSVAGQWRTLQELAEMAPEPLLAELLADMKACFEPGRLMADLARPAPTDEYGAHPAYTWPIIAAAVIGHTEAVPRLKELAAGRNLDVRLAAEYAVASLAKSAGN